MKQAQVMTWAAVMSAALTLGGCAGAQSAGDYQGVDEPLENTYWKLVALDDQPTPVVEGKREAHIVLHTQDSRVAGSTGCNRLMGEYHHDEQELGFGCQTYGHPKRHRNQGREGYDLDVTHRSLCTQNTFNGVTI